MDNEITINDLKIIAAKLAPLGGRAWLYGSRARGDFHEDSDWDILILVDKESEPSDFDVYCTPFIDFGLDHGQYVSARVYTVKQWEQYAFTPFEKNVEQDKIPLN